MQPHLGSELLMQTFQGRYPVIQDQQSDIICACVLPQAKTHFGDFW